MPRCIREHLWEEMMNGQTDIQIDRQVDGWVDGWGEGGHDQMRCKRRRP